MNKRVFGYPADHAGAGIKGKARKVGLITPDNPEYQQCANAGEKVIEAAGNKATRYNYTLDLATLSDQANNIAAKMKADGITTIVLACDPLLPLLLTSRFSQQNYYPEYIVTGVALMDSSVLGQLYDSSQWQHAFGLSMLGEEQPQQASYAYAAIKSVDPDSEPIFGADIFYYFFYQLATGLQMAGPNLSPKTFAAGNAGLSGWRRPGRHLGLPEGHLLAVPGRPRDLVGPRGDLDVQRRQGCLRLGQQALQAGQVAEGCRCGRAARCAGEGSRDGA